MISWKYKLWQSTAVAVLLSACGQPTPAPAPEAPGAPAGGEAAIGEAGGEHGEAGVATAYAGVVGDQRTALRLQHLKGFLLVAERVAEAGMPTDAGVLVQQGLLEVYDPAIDQFGALDPGPVRAAGQGASAQSLRAGEAALDLARGGLSIDYADLAVRMVDLSSGLYQNVVQPDFTDPIEYQHSLGAALSARDALAAGRGALRARDAGAYDEALVELDRFIELWPAPAAPEHPSSYQEVLRQSSRVRLALSPLLQ